MTVAAWRRLLLGLCCVALAILAYRGWLTANRGDPGIALSNFRNWPGSRAPVIVEPGSAAYRAGLRTGNTMLLLALPGTARYRWGEWKVVGEHLTVALPYRGGVRAIAVVARHEPIHTLYWFALAGLAWLALFGGLLAWRRSDSAEARTLALLLIVFPALNSLQLDYFYSPWIGVDLVANALGAFSVLSCALLATYATLFALSRPGAQRTLAALSYAAGGASAVLALVNETRVRFGLFPWSAQHALENAFIAACFGFSLICALVTASQSTGAQRARIVWVTASVGLFYALAMLDFLIAIANPHFFSTFANVIDASIFIAPLGLWCSLLSRRVLDVGFAVNRAAVFTGVSVVIVSIFVLVEWALAQWFSDASHTTNLAIGAALALALGLSVRFIHARVDRVLDAVFFRKRHEDEQAIRTLAREAAYITDADVLLARVVTTLEEHTDASSVRMLLDDGEGTYGGASENDPAIVRLRATRAPLDLHDVRSALEGDIAYPMIARGRLAGAIVLGVKRSGEAYAPDESNAIEQLAHGVASVLDVLSAKAPSQRDDALDELRLTSRAILEAVRALSDRLSGAANVR